MPEALLAFDGWLLRTTLAGGVVLLIGTLWMAFTRQPVQRQRIGELALLAALLVALPAALPTWWSIPGARQSSTTSKALFGQPISSTRLNPFNRDNDKRLAVQAQTDIDEDLDLLEYINSCYARMVEKDENDTATSTGPIDNNSESTSMHGESSSFVMVWWRRVSVIWVWSPSF